MRNFNYLRSVLFAFIFLLCSKTYSQAPGIEWQNTIGGNLDDLLLCSAKTSDGGMILGGGSRSGVSGDKTENAIGSYDFWIVKLDSTGNMIWQNTIGGLADDMVNSIQQTLDGGYIAAGYSGSGMSGDKTEPLIGEYDFWIVKLDAGGNIVWQNTIGGNKNDQATCIRQTSDLGYIVAGFSLSGISGDKTELNQGPATTSDYWIVKLDNAGNILWQNTIGGNYYDYIYAVEQTWDGGYIIGGYSQSGITGDKTEALIGASDFWVLKLNPAGNIQWQNTIGGTGSESIRRIMLAADGGYVLAGFSGSDISGDKTENAYGIGSDYWVVKINSMGNIVWQNDIGGNEDDILLSADNTMDGGYILGGVSYSGMSGDKTENSMGGSDMWVVKITSAGVLEWQNAIGGSSSDEGEAIIQTANGGYAVGGFSKSEISGDKTESNMGAASTYDYWIVKLLNECIPVAEICNTFDDDCNGLIDDGIFDSVTISAAGPTTFCQGGSVVLNAVYSGTAVQWKRNGSNITGATSPSYTVMQKGTYTCETTSPCGSAISENLTVIINKNPPASITPGGPLTFCAGGSVVLTANAGAGLTYQWYKGASAIAGATLINYTATTTGNYKCRVTKTATGCYKNSNTIAVSVPCKEGESMISNHENILSIYPNPNTGNFNVTGIISPDISRRVSIEIYNSFGQLVYLKQFESSDMINETIELNETAKGIYFVRIQNGENINEQKLVVE